MPEYTLAATLTAAAALLVAAWRRRLREPSIWFGLAAFAALTLVADVALTQVGVFRYDPRFLSGIRVDRMPIEDLEYGVALYLVAVSTWRVREGA